MVNTPNGNLTVKFLRLFSLAPTTVINCPFPFLLDSGTLTSFSPVKYWPVIDSLHALISSTVPAAIICPPCSPALGPISTIKSASLIVSSSCSTTITVFPTSLKFFKV